MSPGSPPSPGYDFFISYTGKDVAWAEWIAWHLEEAKYKTLIQAWDFKSGGVFPGDMHRALQQSTRVIAVLTPAYMESGFCQPEWQAAFAKDPTGEKGILVCVRVSDFMPDGLLAGRTYIDLVGKEPDAAVVLLLQRLKEGRGKPAVAPPHPGTGSSKPSAPAPAFPGAAPSTSAIPQNLPGGYIGRLFLGRDDFLDKLRESLQNQTHHATAITQQAPVATGISGLGGIGKTHAAVEYAHRHRGDYSALLFVSGETPERLNAELASLCGVLHLDADGNLAPEEPVRVAAAVHWLSTHKDWLLIVDNVDDEKAAAALTDLLADLTSGHVLITTRLHGWADNVEALNIEVLSPEAATALLLQLTAKQRRPAADDEAQARLLADLLEGLPLALHQAAGYINQKRLTLAAYLAIYEKEASELLAWFKPHLIHYSGPEALGPRPVWITWKASFDKLEPDTRRWLRVFAHFAPEPIPEFLLESLPDADEPTKARHRAAFEAVVQAETYSLLTRDRELPRFKLHRLVQHIIRLTSTEAENATALDEAIQLIAESKPGDTQDARTWHKWNPLQAHAVALCDHAPDEPAPDRLSWLLNNLAVLAGVKALYRQAEPLMRRALTIDESNFGPDHPDIACALNNLARLLQDTNRLAEAEPLIRRALVIAGASFGMDHPNVATVLSNLAHLLQATNRLAEAESLYHQALRIDEASFGLDHRTVAIRLNNLAQLFQDTNRLTDAEPLMRRGVNILEATLGPDHPNVATSLNNLALLLQATNRLAEAELFYCRALQIAETSLGPVHPTVALYLNNLAQLLKHSKRFAEAEPLMRRALEINEASLGKDHPKVATSLNNIALLLKATNRAADAEPLMRRALKIFEASLGENHHEVARALSNFAQLLQATNRLAEAEPLMRRALQVDEASFGPKHPAVGRDLNNLAGLLKSTHRLAEAEPMMYRALKIIENSLGVDHPRSQVVRENYQGLCQEMEDLKR